MVDLSPLDVCKRRTLSCCCFPALLISARLAAEKGCDPEVRSRQRMQCACQCFEKQIPVPVKERNRVWDIILQTYQHIIAAY